MKFIQLKIVPFFKKNIEVLLLISLLIVSIFITQLYNVNTKKLQKDYLEILRNSYFKKSVSYLFSNLKPKYEKIDYKIKTGETLISDMQELVSDKEQASPHAYLLNNPHLVKIREKKFLRVKKI